MEDLLYLTQRYRVSIEVKNQSQGTSGQWAYISATVVIENSGTKLTASAMVMGDRDQQAESREEAVRSALAGARRRAELLETD